MALLKLLKSRGHLARKLSFLEWITLCEAWWLLLFYYLVLRWMSSEHLTTSIYQISKKILDTSYSLIFAEKVHRLVGFASRLHLAPMTCLVKSLALQQILRTQNIPAQIRIGAQKIQGAMYAHAWIEVNEYQ